MAITFNTIPVSIRSHGSYIEYDNTRAVQGSPAIPNVALVIGQRLSSGTIAEAIPTLVSSVTVAETYWGHGSILAGMCEKFKAVNPYTELWAIALDDDAGGVAATGTFPFAGTSTAAGNIYLYIAGERIVIPVASGVAANTAIAVAVAAAVNNYVLDNNLPVSASSSLGTVTITCLHKGTLGNGIKLELNYNEGEALPPGITCTPVAMANGATDPDIADAIAVFSDTWYKHVISSFADDTNQDLLETELLARWGPTVKKDGHSYIGAIGNQGTLTTAGNARNSQFTTLFGGGLSPTPAWIWATVAGAVNAAEPDPARPRQELWLQGCLPPKPEDRFTFAEREILLTDGVSTYTVSRDGKCYVSRMITTYQTNPSGIPDVSYLNIETMMTLAYIRFTLDARINLRYPRHKLAEDGTNFGPGQAVVTPAIIKTTIFSLFTEWERDGLVEGWEQFKKDIIIERNANDRSRVDVRLSPDLMNQFVVLAGQIQYLL